MKNNQCYYNVVVNVNNLKELHEFFNPNNKSWIRSEQLGFPVFLKVNFTGEYSIEEKEFRKIFGKYFGEQDYNITKLQINNNSKIQQEHLPSRNIILYEARDQFSAKYNTI